MKLFLKAFLALVVLCLPMNATKPAVFHTDNGLSVSVQACTDGIFRIKLSPRADFAESLMERYGLLETSWDSIPMTTTCQDNKFTVATATCTLTIDKATGRIAVSDAQGKPLMGDLTFRYSADSLSQQLADTINARFSKLTVASNGGIIGDDDGTFSAKDRMESGDVDKSSMLRIMLSPDERFYGAGSASHDHIQHRGELLRMWTTYQHTEIPMPFVFSSNHWGIYNNTTRKNFFDIGNLDPNVLAIYNTCDEADFYLMFGHSMPDLINDYTRITRRSYVLPKWAYGLCFGPNMLENQFEILADAVRFRQTQTPCDVLWLEPQWMEKRYDFSTEKTWNNKLFAVEPYWQAKEYPKHEHHNLLIGRLHDMGFKLGLWLCIEYDLSQVEENLIDVAAGRDTLKTQWMDHLKPFLDLGVDGFKMDPARTIDEHTFLKYANKRTDKEMHNLNQTLLPKQMNQMTRQHTGRRSWHHYCGGWTGVQHWGAATSGDNGGGRKALLDQLNLGMSGYSNTSCDVLSVQASDELPSLHFGMFLPWVQINSWYAMLQPFYYSDYKQDVYRDYVKLRYALMPYIYSAALEASQNGMPIVRSMPLQFPNDRNCDDMMTQYMFGDNLMVGIFCDSIYLPKGQWTDFWTGEQVEGHDAYIKRAYPKERAGLLFARQGAIIPMQHDVQFIDCKPMDRYIIRVFPNGHSKYTLYEDDGQSYGYEEGKVAKTLFTCTQVPNEVMLTINPTDGRYDSIPQRRTYDFQVKVPFKPASVKIQGQRCTDVQYADGMAHFTVSEADINIPVLIQITMTSHALLYTIISTIVVLLASAGLFLLRRLRRHTH